MLASIIIVGGIVAVWLGYTWGKNDGRAQGYFDGRRDAAEQAKRGAATAVGASTSLPGKPVQAVAQLGKPVFAAAKKAPKKKKKSSY